MIDLEKARDVAGFMIVHNCYGGERFADTLAEVERLRADLRNCSAYVGIGPGEGDLPIPERVRRTVNRLNGSVHRYEQKILAKDVQIRSLKIEETNLTGQIEQLEAEIERLRNDLQDCGSYVGIGPGEGDLPIPERVRRCVNRLKETQNHYSQKLIAKDAEIERLRADNAGLSKAVISVQEERDLAQAEFRTYHKAWEEQAARIQELEDAHKRSGAKYVKIINELRSSVYANIPGLKKQWDEILNTSANGKIGPDADECPDDLPPIGSPYRSWQITEERVRAIQWGSEMAGDCKAGDALRTMLKEAVQE